MTLADILKRTTECGDCRLWTGSTNGAGQPKLFNGTARRAVYKLAFGEIPKGKRISVSCGQRTCLEPKHLKAVTVAEISTITNANPAVKLKKQVKCARIKRATTGKITMEIARQIRMSEKSGLEWAAELQCSPSLISLVRRNKSWVEHSNPFTGLVR